VEYQADELLCLNAELCMNDKIQVNSELEEEFFLVGHRTLTFDSFSHDAHCPILCEVSISDESLLHDFNKLTGEITVRSTDEPSDLYYVITCTGGLSNSSVTFSKTMIFEEE
jgi:hypothetical protein